MNGLDQLDQRFYRRGLFLSHELAISESFGYRKGTCMKRKSNSDWQRLAGRRLGRILEVIRAFPGLARLGPKNTWHVDIQLVNRTTMIRLNGSYRGKKYPTDVLSFTTLEPFRRQGFLGELVICLPTLRSQAKALEHSPEFELEVLLIHGVLHLLGLDHELGEKEARQMAKWERRVLEKTKGSSRRSQLLGLIERSSSGT